VGEALERIKSGGESELSGSATSNEVLPIYNIPVTMKTFTDADDPEMCTFSLNRIRSTAIFSEVDFVGVVE